MTQTITGTDIDIFRWLSVKAQLKLEGKGLRSSGGPIRPRLAVELGLKPRDSREKYIAAIDAKVLAIKEAP